MFAPSRLLSATDRSNHGHPIKMIRCRVGVFGTVADRSRPADTASGHYRHAEVERHLRPWSLSYIHSIARSLSRARLGPVAAHLNFNPAEGIVEPMERLLLRRHPARPRQASAGATPLGLPRCSTSGNAPHPAPGFEAPRSAMAERWRSTGTGRAMAGCDRG